jgi:hypothetical protein
MTPLISMSRDAPRRGYIENFDMSTFTELQKFISGDMQMSQAYQPVMLRERLKNSGKATVMVLR